MTGKKEIRDAFFGLKGRFCQPRPKAPKAWETDVAISFRHAKKSFQDELRDWLRRYEIEWERYVWD
jgi:hypothetical protein